jgi:hypothetical protein
MIVVVAELAGNAVKLCEPIDLPRGTRRALDKRLRDAATAALKDTRLGNGVDFESLRSQVEAAMYASRLVDRWWMERDRIGRQARLRQMEEIAKREQPRRLQVTPLGEDPPLTNWQPDAGAASVTGEAIREWAKAEFDAKCAELDPLLDELTRAEEGLRTLAKRLADTRPAEEWIRVSDAANRFGISGGTLSRAANAEHIQTNGKQGRGRLLNLPSVVAYVDARSEKNRQKEAIDAAAAAAYREGHKAANR